MVCSISGLSRCCLIACESKVANLRAMSKRSEPSPAIEMAWRKWDINPIGDERLSS